MHHLHFPQRIVKKKSLAVSVIQGSKPRFDNVIFPKSHGKRVVMLGSAPRMTVSRLGSHPRSPAFKSFWGTSLEYEGLGAPTSGVRVLREKGWAAFPTAAPTARSGPHSVWGGKGRAFHRQGLKHSELSLSLPILKMGATADREAEAQTAPLGGPLAQS